MSDKMMVFTIAGTELDRVQAFMDEHRLCADDFYSGRYEFTFCPCSHGMPKTVTCICGETLYLDPELHTGGDDNIEDFLK